MSTRTKPTAISEPTNGAENIIAAGMPYQVSIAITGTADFLFHRWNCETVEEKSKSAKNSAGRKMDDLESYVYRDDAGALCIPGEYLRMAIIAAAKFKQDPRSPRKSAMDLFKAGIIPLTNLASLGTNTWDYEDKRRAVIQRAGINRVRPAMKSGWKVGFDFLVNLPEYIDKALLLDVTGMAGRLIGIGDFRPTFGRFQVTSFR